MPLDVRWPDASLSLEPKTIPTYPEINVTARVVFHKTNCKPAIGTLVPETWLDLIYCGHSPVSCTNSTHKQVNHIKHTTQNIVLSMVFQKLITLCGIIFVKFTLNGARNLLLFRVDFKLMCVERLSLIHI